MRREALGHSESISVTLRSDPKTQFDEDSAVGESGLSIRILLEPKEFMADVQMACPAVKSVAIVSKLLR